MVFSLFLIAFGSFSHIYIVYKIFFSPLPEKWHHTVAFLFSFFIFFFSSSVAILSALVMHKRNTGYFISSGLPMLYPALHNIRIYEFYYFISDFFSTFFALWFSCIFMLRSHMRNKIESHKIFWNGIKLLCTAMRIARLVWSLHELTAFALFVWLNKWEKKRKKTGAQ